MEFLEVIKKRRSIRHFKSRPLSKSTLKRIFEAVRLAPSASNLQPWLFIVITDSELKKKIAKACYDQMFMAEAPIIIAAFEDKQAPWYKVNVSIAMSQLILAATNEGLGTCWIGAWYDEYDIKINEWLSVPSKYGLVALTPLGYPDETPKPIHRKKLEEILYFNKYQP